MVMKNLGGFLVAVMCLVMAVPAWAAGAKPTLLFIPHDDRPISFSQTVDVVRKLDYEVLTPPQALLGNRNDFGQSDALWEWLFVNAKQANAVVLSSDALLYGSLVASRKHNADESLVMRRMENFAKLKQENPRLKIYVFGSIMRTPRSGASAGTEEPSYYAQYGADIFRLTALQDKSETLGLAGSEKREAAALQARIPSAAIDDWMTRRNKNFKANKQMVELAKQGQFKYLVLGLDDNAQFSQTNKESRLLREAGSTLDISRFQTLAGIDEMGVALLARAVNDLTWQIPLVYAEYGDGVGAKTIPSYANEDIGKAVRCHLLLAGAVPAFSDARADAVLLVNTNKDGQTYEANYPQNTTVPRSNTKSFVDKVEAQLTKGKKVAVADIAFANGGDNAMMAEMKSRELIPKLTVYSGWNTATNSTGFAIGEVLMAKDMTDGDKNYLLTVRLLDDWAYQGNIRQTVANDPAAMKGGAYAQLDNAKPKVIARTTELIAAFARENMPEFSVEGLTVDFPWNRMFESDVRIKDND